MKELSLNITPVIDPEVIKGDYQIAEKFEQAKFQKFTELTKKGANFEKLKHKTLVKGIAEDSKIRKLQLDNIKQHGTFISRFGQAVRNMGKSAGQGLGNALSSLKSGAAGLAKMAAAGLAAFAAGSFQRALGRERAGRAVAGKFSGKELASITGEIQGATSEKLSSVEATDRAAELASVKADLIEKGLAVDDKLLGKIAKFARQVEYLSGGRRSFGEAVKAAGDVFIGDLKSAGNIVREYKGEKYKEIDLERMGFGALQKPEQLTSVFDEMAEDIAEQMGKVPVSNIKSGFDRLNDLKNKALDAGADALEKFVGWLDKLTKDPTSALQDLWKAVNDGIAGFFTNLWNFIKTYLNPAEWISSIIAWIKDKLSFLNPLELLKVIKDLASTLTSSPKPES